MPPAATPVVPVEWFIPVFVVLWLFVTGLLSFFSGWLSLAARFRAHGEPEGERFGFVAGAWGAGGLPLSYGRTLFVTVHPSGFHLSVMVLLRLFSPPLFIPWEAVESVTEKQTLFKRYALICIRGHGSRLALHGRAGRAVKQAFERHAAGAEAR